MEIAIIEHIAALCATSSTAADLSRKLVHSDVIGKDAVGAVFYLVTQAGDLDLIGSYGKTPVVGEDISIWANNPLARCVGDRSATSDLMQANDGSKVLVAAVPILKGSDPIGVAAVLRTEGGKPLAEQVSDSAIRAVANTYAIWIDSLGLKNGNGNGSHVSEADGNLTERQMEILRQMAQGRTNAQIAAELILSESSIRQETVRIYRALGVGTRAEAARKALNLGLIEKVAI
jgi:DNA-binding CsgD family transcriptional regulator